MSSFRTFPLSPLVFFGCANGHRPAHMKRLFNTCNSPKVWRSFPNGSHNDTINETGYFEAIYEFMLAVVNNKLDKILTRKSLEEEPMDMTEMGKIKK